MILLIKKMFFGHKVPLKHCRVCKKISQFRNTPWQANKRVLGEKASIFFLCSCCVHWQGAMVP